MSGRNNKRAAPKASRKRQESISSTTTFDYASANSFSDNHYSAVEDIDDEEEDDDDVEAVEEQAIVDNVSTTSTPRPDPTVNDNEDDANDGDDESDNKSDVSSLSDASDQTWGGLSDTLLEYDNRVNEEPLATHDAEQARRVRFAEPSDDSDSSTDDDRILMFPDLFVDQAMLDPNFRYTIENDDDNSSVSDSFWDWETHNHIEEPTGTTPDMPGIPVFDDPSPFIKAELMDDSDGETTEDEDYPEGPIMPPTTESHVPEDDSDSEIEAPVRRADDEPLTTAFNLNKRRSKPIVVWNTKTKKMMIYTQVEEEIVAPPPFLLDNSFIGSLTEPSSPLKNGDIALSAGTPFPPHDSGVFGDPSYQQGMDIDWNNMYNIDPFRDTDPWDMQMPTQAADTSSTSTFSEDRLEMDAFLDMGSASEEDGNILPASTPVRPTTASSDADVLGHLHSSNVGAFRQNQVNARLIRNGATQDSIDFSGPYQSTVIKGIRSDRFDTAMAPLTPVRRHKRHNSDAARSPLDAASTKRKASAEPSTSNSNNHKKQKSISTELTDMHM